MIPGLWEILGRDAHPSAKDRKLNDCKSWASRDLWEMIAFPGAETRLVGCGENLVGVWNVQVSVTLLSVRTGVSLCVNFLEPPFPRTQARCPTRQEVTLTASGFWRLQVHGVVAGWFLPRRRREKLFQISSPSSVIFCHHWCSLAWRRVPQDLPSFYLLFPHEHTVLAGFLLSIRRPVVLGYYAP